MESVDGDLHTPLHTVRSLGARADEEAFGRIFTYDLREGDSCCVVVVLMLTTTHRPVVLFFSCNGTLLSLSFVDVEARRSL